MLAGEGTPIANHQVRCPFNKLTVFANTGFALEIEADAHVDASMPEVSVEGAFITVLIHEGANIAQIAPQFFRGYCCIVPSFPLWRRARRKGGRPRPGFAQLPDMSRFDRRVEAGVGC